LRYSALVKIATQLVSPTLAVTILGHALLEDEGLTVILREEANVEHVFVKTIAPVKTYT
jgi:hypothetical protein